MASAPPRPMAALLRLLPAPIRRRLEGDTGRRFARFVLVALRPADARWFRWPAPDGTPPLTVGQALEDLMAARGWPGAADWAAGANRIAPTIVGGSKKHGGGDLGPTRAKRAWADLGVDGLGIADEAPGPADSPRLAPRLTCAMVARLQGWQDAWGWQFTGRKTARYRQLGNAFPPPVAEAVGSAIRAALLREGPRPGRRPETVAEAEHGGDPVYAVLRSHGGFMTAAQIAIAAAHTPSGPTGARQVLRRIADLSQDFEVETADLAGQPAYRLGQFKAFLGQQDHTRHQRFQATRATIS